MATEVVVSDEDKCSDSARDATRVSFNVQRARRRSATRTESDRWRRSLQTCPVESNEEMLEGLLEGPEGVKWELGLACFCPGKMGFRSLGLGFGHWEWEKKCQKWEWDNYFEP